MLDFWETRQFYDTVRRAIRYSALLDNEFAHLGRFGNHFDCGIVVLEVHVIVNFTGMLQPILD